MNLVFSHKIGRVPVHYISGLCLGLCHSHRAFALGTRATLVETRRGQMRLGPTWAAKELHSLQLSLPSVKGTLQNESYTFQGPRWFV